MHRFEHQDSAQTLAEGVSEYYRSNPGLAQGRGLSAAAAEFFRCHDAVHVVFGCGNALSDEAIVKISSVFGTTGSVQILRGYRLHESIEIYKSLRIGAVLFAVLCAVLIVPRTIMRCMMQRKRWPWDRFEPYLDMPLQQIRSEFGIKVAHRRSAQEKI